MAQLLAGRVRRSQCTTRAPARSGSLEADAQLLHLLLVDGRGRPGHKVHGRAVWNAMTSGSRTRRTGWPQSGRDRRQPPWRRLLQRVEEEAEAHPCFVVRDPSRPENVALERLIVDPDAAAGDFAVQTSRSARALPGSLPAGPRRLERRGERWCMNSQRCPPRTTRTSGSRRPTGTRTCRVEQVLLPGDAFQRSPAFVTSIVLPAAINNRSPDPRRRCRAPAGSPPPRRLERRALTTDSAMRPTRGRWRRTAAPARRARPAAARVFRPARDDEPAHTAAGGHRIAKRSETGLGERRRQSPSPCRSAGPACRNRTSQRVGMASGGTAAALPCR